VLQTFQCLAYANLHLTVKKGGKNWCPRELSHDQIWPSLKEVSTSRTSAKAYRPNCFAKKRTCALLRKMGGAQCQVFIDCFYKRITGYSLRQRQSRSSSSIAIGRNPSCASGGRETSEAAWRVIRHFAAAKTRRLEQARRPRDGEGAFVNGAKVFANEILQ